MKIVFVRTRYHYQSYVDYWRIVELSGFETCYVDEVDISKECVYIVSPMNGEWRPHIERQRSIPRNAVLCHWNLERPGGSGGLNQYRKSNIDLVDYGYINHTIISDYALSREVPHSLYTPFGVHPDFGAENKEPKFADFIHLSCFSQRRSFLFENAAVPRSRIGEAIIAPNSWGDVRHHWLLQSKWMLNIHQDGYQYMEPIRFMIAASYGLPIITETCKDVYPYSHLAAVTQHTHDQILSVMADRVRENYDEWMANGNRLREYMLENYLFRDCIEGLLSWL